MSKFPGRHLALLAALIIALSLIGPAGPAQAAALPGGKANYVVSFGSLHNPGGNWVRLGTYRFSTDGRVQSDTWVWSQSAPAARVGTGTVPDGGCSGTSATVRKCEVKTVAGFQAAAPESRGGTYTLYTGTDGIPVVNIQWDTTTWRSEEWKVEIAPDGTYSRLTFKYSQKFTHGYGYGSNKGFGERRAMDTVAGHQAALRMTYSRAAHGTVTPVYSVWGMSNFIPCTGTTWCLTYKIATASTGTCSCPAPYDTDRSIQNYIQKVSSHDRRDTFWHWCTCLAKGSACYQGNSHVYPLLQVIDDNGGWRGWVGVEASFYPYAESDARSRDMLSVFRVAEWV